MDRIWAFKMEPLVYIIILNYNGGQEIIECLQSCQKIHYPRFRILVVDNASADHSIAQIKKQFKEVAVIQNQENLGFAAGNNVGIKYALSQKADYVLLLNNDTVVSEDFLTKMVQLAEKETNIGIAVPKILYYQSNKLWEGWGKKIDYIRGRVTVSTEEAINQPQETIHATGCAMLIKRAVFEKIGFLSEDYFMYFEDIDFSLKARKAGFKIFYQPKAVIWHRFNRGTSLMNQYYWQRSRVIFALKCAPNILIKTLAFVWILFRICKLFFKYQLSKLRGTEDQESKLVYQATINGLKKDKAPLTNTGEVSK